MPVTTTADPAPLRDPAARATQPAVAVDAAANLACGWPDWPVYGLTDDLLPPIERWARAGHRVAVATLVDIQGTSPRPLGSEMAIRDDGRVAGYVSGGCVEGAVAAEALAVLREGKPRLLDYGAGSPVLDIQLTCGGRIGIFVREIADAADYAARLRRVRAARQPLEVRVDLTTGAQGYGPTTAAAAPEGGARQFAITHLPPVRIVVMGGNPVALAVCGLAAHLGYEAVLLRPYGPAEPPSDVALVAYDRRAVQAAVDALSIDAWTAVYALTHHPQEDLALLARALPSPAFAVGVLGSRTKIQERLARLQQAGLDAAALDRLHAPAGLAIGAQGPHEIALAILAQIVASRPQPAARLLAGTGSLLQSGVGPGAVAACGVA